MDFSALTDFLADARTPPCEEHEESQPNRQQTTAAAQETATGGRVIRRRARKACVECHKRKVRCDVLTRGQVCTNCRLDGLPCRLPAKDGRRRTQSVQEPTITDTSEVQLPVVESAAPISAPPIISAIQSDDIVQPGIPSFIPIRDETSSFCNAWSFRPSSEPSINNNALQSTTSHIDVIFGYYGFIESQPLSHVPAEDFKFLENKGCFHVPSRPILDEFIKEYFLHVHPVLPILDEGKFWDMYLCDGRVGAAPTTKISLFLLRAMLFVSSSFVSEDLLKQMGFRDAFEARLNFYRRSKLLFDFDTTNNPISIAQGALLLTYYSADREPLANTSWLRIAIQYSQQVQAHLYTQHPQKDRAMLKRLWWCCILRDRILPLGVRRSIQITHSTFPLLTSPRLTAADLECEFGKSKVYDYGTKLLLARILERQVELAIILTDVLGVIYPVGGLDHNCLMKMPGRVGAVKRKLNFWLQGLQGDFEASDRASHKSVVLFLGLTEIYYHSAQAALCQYESLSFQAGASLLSSTSPQRRNQELGTALHSSIASISATVGEMVQLDIARYLPVSAVAYMALPIILNSIDLQKDKLDKEKGEVGGVGKIQAKRHQLRLYNEAMSICHARYSGTGQCLRYIDQTIAAAKSGLQDSKGTERMEKQLERGLMKLTEGRNKMDDWFEAFVSKPRQYLRIALTVDLWMSCGRMAGSEDLPRVLMLEDAAGDGTQFGVPKSLDLDSARVIEELISPHPREAPSAGAVKGRRRDLDYFDFGGTGAEINSYEDMLDIVNIGVDGGEGFDIVDFGLEHGNEESEIGSASVESVESGGDSPTVGDEQGWNGDMVEDIMEDVLKIGTC